MRIRMITMIDNFCKSFSKKKAFSDKRLLNRFYLIIQEMMSAGNTKLTEICRHRIEAGKNQFCQYVNIQRFFNNDRWSYEAIKKRLSYVTGRFISSKMVVGFDFTEIIKPKGRKMEHIAYVRDGKTNSNKLGYWAATAAVKIKNQLMPLYFHPFSVEADEVKSKTDEMLKAIDAVYRSAKNKDFVAAFDREFDNSTIIDDLIDRESLSFVIRANHRRTLYVNGIKYTELKDLVPILKEKEKVRQYSKKNYYVSFISVKTERFGKLSLVYSEDCSNPDRTWFLYTNQKVKNYKDALKVIHQYKKRWQVETTIRTVKQEMSLESSLLRKYTAMQKMMLLSTICIFMTTKLLLQAPKKLCKMIKQEAEVFTKEIKHFAVLIAYRKIISSKLTDEEMGQLLAEKMCLN